jgi:sterol desaturase/sphingolipid hydroxylase (fatty acid hydroxylase superfamily)
MDAISARFENLLAVLSNIFLSVGSSFSMTSLLCALIVATGYIVWRRRRRGRAVRARTVLAGLFPRKIWKSASMTADLWLFFLNAFVMGTIFGWALLSFHVVGTSIPPILDAAFGARDPIPLPDWAARALFTLILFLAYEFGYWLDHWLSHRVPVLWEFHKVHHSAQHLTPLTVWRMHPVNTVVFSNILALSMAVIGSTTAWAMGGAFSEYAYNGTNVILIVFVHLYVHLQHSHIWISFQGWLGRTFMSPAHHQIHHSNNPEHFDKNMGSCLCLFDWLFGTLHVPAKEPEKLTFGIDADHDVNTITAGLITPFVDAAKHVLPQGRPAGGEAKPGAG